MSLRLYGCTLVAAFLMAGAITGPAHAAPDNHDIVRNSWGHVARNSFGNCVRTRWMSDHDACAPKQMARQKIAQEERTVYFEFNKTALTADSVRKLNSLATNLMSDDQVKEARIHGYADRIGTASYNERLSKRRADTVRQYMVSRGFIKGRVADTRWYGESVPVTRCSDDLPREELIQCLQRDRKVEVEIDYLTTQ